MRKSKSSDFISDDEREEAGEYVIPVGPTEDMQEIIECATGARAIAHVQQELFACYKCIVAVPVGLGTALKNGMLMSSPTPYDPTNMSPHFTPPNS